MVALNLISSQLSARRVATNLIPLLMLFEQAGCSKKQPTEDWAVTGRVVDSMGVPVPSANVAIDYSVTTQPSVVRAVNWHDGARLSGIERDSTCIGVWDLCGEPVVELRCGAGICGWDGRNSSGRIVSPGVYRARIGSCDSSNADTEYLVLVKPKPLAGVIGPKLTPVAITDAQGRFAIRPCGVATGIPLECQNDYGVQDTCVVLDSITVFAWGDSLWGEVTAVHSARRTTNVEIHLETRITRNTNSPLLDEDLLPIEL